MISFHFKSSSGTSANFGSIFSGSAIVKYLTLEQVHRFSRFHLFQYYKKESVRLQYGSDFFPVVILATFRHVSYWKSLFDFSNGEFFG